MRHKLKKIKLGTDKDHQRSLLRTLAMQVIIYEKVKTTVSKARTIQPFIEKLISIAKKENRSSAIREITQLIQHENCSKKIFEELIPKYKDKKSGFTKITHIGNRAGDNAPLVQIELI